MTRFEARGAVRLVELSWDRDTAYCSFEADPIFEPLLWDERVLRISSSEGVRLDAEALAAAFVVALAPLGWMCGAEISTGSLAVPEPALRCLDRVGEWLRRHYHWPQFQPFARIATRPRRWSYPRSHRGLAWSGGVDSSFALLNLEREIDWLIHLTNFENLESRMTAAQREEELGLVRRTAVARGLGWMHLRTNIASIFKHNRFDHHFPPECSFWLGLEHLHHIATALTVVRSLLAEVLIAGGFSELHRRVGSCAADAAFVALYDYPAPMRLVDELVPRQQKIEQLVDRAPELLQTLRVCYSSGDGTCANCNKCLTTALMIVAAGGSLAAGSFPPGIGPNLLARIETVRDAPPEEHRSLNQALDGRRLSGSRSERWSQLERFIALEIAAGQGASM